MKNKYGKILDAVLQQSSRLHHILTLHGIEAVRTLPLIWSHCGQLNSVCGGTDFLTYPLIHYFVATDFLV